MNRPPCPICAFADTRGWYGRPGAHCRDCHRSWTSKVEAHCAALEDGTRCCEHFSSNSAADLHWLKGRHVSPETIRRLVRRETAHGPVWTDAEAVERLEKLAVARRGAAIARVSGRFSPATALQVPEPISEAS